MCHIQSLHEIKVIQVRVWLTYIFCLSVIINMSMSDIWENQRQTFGLFVTYEPMSNGRMSYSRKPKKYTLGVPAYRELNSDKILLAFAQLLWT
jgi:hypothetical protein